jgi:acetyl-CoA carboxylase carboxyl transferase subunit alpha
LWRDAAQAPAAAEAMRLTADDLRRLHLADEVIPEPLGGAHRDPETAVHAVGDAMARALEELLPLDGATLRARRREKFLSMGHDALG